MVFKTGLLIIAQYENMLSESNFAASMSFLSDLGKTDLSTSIESIENKEKEGTEMSRDLKFTIFYERNIRNLKGFSRVLTEIHKALDILDE